VDQLQRFRFSVFSGHPNHALIAFRHLVEVPIMLPQSLGQEFYDIFTKNLAECKRTILEGMARDGLQRT
jgi:hypothetical protein